MTFLFADILDFKEYKFNNIDGLKITEISALSYNNNTLYALSDRGYLYAFSLNIKNKKINFIKIKSAKKLKNKKGKKLKNKKRDSEGLYFIEDKLLISFERKPRIVYFSLDGIKIKNAKINQELLDKDNYRGSNKMLEAVTYSKKYGVLTAPELPLTSQAKCEHKLYTHKSTYKFLACGNITALEFISEDEVLILFRDLKLIIFNLKNSKTDEIKFRHDFKDYIFEGLTKVGENLYLIVNDNHGKTQKTLFVLFEL